MRHRRTQSWTQVHREPWNKGKSVGQKTPFKFKDADGAA